MATFGGIMQFRLPDGSNLAIRGSVSHMPGRFSFEKITNANGTNDRSAKAEGFEAAVSFSNRAVNGQEVDWDALMLLEGITCTLLCDNERVDRTFTGAFFFGRPSIDDMTGEVTGIQIAAEGYAAVPR